MATKKQEVEAEIKELKERISNLDYAKDYSEINNLYIKLRSAKYKLNNLKRGKSAWGYGESEVIS